MIGRTNAGGGGGDAKITSIDFTLTDGANCTYGTISADSIGFTPKFIIFRSGPSVGYYGTHILTLDINTKKMYGYSTTNTNVVFPDGTARFFDTASYNGSVLPRDGTDVTPTYTTYGGVQYATIQQQDSLWIHSDGSIRFWTYDQYDDGSGKYFLGCIFIG